MLKVDRHLWWWAITALVLFALIVTLPVPILDMLFVSPNTNVAIRALCALVVIVAIPGFYLLMFFECGFARNLPWQSAWIIPFMLLPIFSAFLYFFVTRSNWYREYLKNAQAK